MGRHALLFDDDPTAEVVNSGGSLVPWAAVGADDLLLDRHDVRHLLDRVPPRPRRSYSAALLSAPSLDGVSEAELDRERFLDLTADDFGGEGSQDAVSSGIRLFPLLLTCLCTLSLSSILYCNYSAYPSAALSPLVAIGRCEL